MSQNYLTVQNYMSGTSDTSAEERHSQTPERWTLSVFFNILHNINNDFLHLLSSLFEFDWEWAF